MKPIDECKTVAELLEEPERWTKGALARNANDAIRIPSEADAVRFCLIGAIMKINGTDWRTADLSDVVCRIADRLGVLDWNEVVDWNNSTRRTHAEVLALATELGI